MRLITLLIIWTLTIQLNAQDVLLVGDSISISYARRVTPALKKEGVTVRHIGSNGGHSANGVKNISAWLEGKPDIVFFNFGIHDALKMAPERKQRRHTVQQYVANLKVILDKIKKTGATPVWVTTTPVKTQGIISNDDVVRYNIAAIKFMKSEGVNFLNVYSPMKPWILKSKDGLHFDSEGNKAISQLVIKKLREMAAKFEASP